MLDIIRSQFDSGNGPTKNKFYHLSQIDRRPPYYFEFYPLGQDYFHELNPYFLFNYHNKEIFKISKLVTVRDGLLSFSNFILGNFTDFSSLESGPMLIHPDLAPLVPPTLRDQFAVWKRVQKNQIKLTQAKKVIIFGFLNEEYLGPIEELSRRLSPLRKIPKSTKVDVCVSIRKHIFESQHRDSLIPFQVISLIKELLPEHELNFVKMNELLETTDFFESYLFDMAYDQFLVSDSYLHYFTQSRGVTVNNDTLMTSPKDSIFSLDLSLYHELHICPLPQVENKFSEIYFYKKFKAKSSNLLFDQSFQNLLRKIFKKEV